MEGRYFSKKLRFPAEKKPTAAKEKVKNVREDKWIVQNPKLSDEDKKAMVLKRKEKRDKAKKLKQIMKKRLIIRNLSFKVSEEQLKDIFSKYGDVIDVTIPLNKEGRKRGFAFLCYKTTKSQYAAIRELNFKKIEGRPIAIDVAIPKKSYQSDIKTENDKPKSDKQDGTSDSEDSEDEDLKPDIKVEPSSDCTDSGEDEKDKKINKFLKEFDANAKDEESAEEVDESDESSDDDDGNEEKDDDTESLHSQEPAKSNEKPKNRKESNDVSEGKTIFIRNISFKNTEEDLQELMEEYGDIEYCLLCLDPVTDHPKGTGFVKFKSKESADKVIEESYIEPGIILDGRKLLCAYAMSRGDVSKISNKPDKVKDKRNLRLLKCGLIMKDSPEAEGVSQADMTKRLQLEMVKKQKLRNVNFFVSDTRLAIHNLPKNVTDKDLFNLFKKAGGKGGIVKEARVMKDFNKTDAAGFPMSRGFGFVSFSEHQHALKAIAELNNNPTTFTSQKRPIVEFSVENKVALYSQEKKKERMKMRNKRRTEEKFSKNEVIENEQIPQQNENQTNKQKKRKNKRKNSPNKKAKQDVQSTQPSEGKSHFNKQTKMQQKKRKSKGKFSPTKESKLTVKSLQPSGATQSNKSEKKQKRPQKNKNKGVKQKNQVYTSLSQLTNKYKEKLLNKLS